MGSFPSYDPSNYPEGLTDFLNTFPPERRQSVRAAVVDLHFRRKAEKNWVGEQIQQMLDLPDILYKYIPFALLDCGCPNSLRATQPAALNDVMEANIRTSMESRIDRDKWYAGISRSLKEIFGNDALSDEELDRRKRLYGDPRVSTIIRDYLSRFVGVVSFAADPLVPPMWAHYAENSGFVVGYNTNSMKDLGIVLSIAGK